MKKPMRNPMLGSLAPVLLQLRSHCHLRQKCNWPRQRQRLTSETNSRQFLNQHTLTDSTKFFGICVQHPAEGSIRGRGPQRYLSRISSCIYELLAPHSLGACGPLMSIIRHCTTSESQAKTIHHPSNHQENLVNIYHKPS